MSFTLQPADEDLGPLKRNESRPKISNDVAAWKTSCIDDDVVALTQDMNNNNNTSIAP